MSPKEVPNVSLPLFASYVAAGFPSPADDYLECGLNLNEYLIRHPAATFFVRARGDSMRGAGIFNNDILVVDRALEATNRDVVLAVIDGEFTVKRFRKKDGRLSLVAENPGYRSIEISEERSFEVWGVVTYVIHQLLKN